MAAAYAGFFSWYDGLRTLRREAPNRTNLYFRYKINELVRGASR